MQLLRLGEELVFGFFVSRVRYAGLDRTHRRALRLGIESHAFGARDRIDDRDVTAGRDRVIRTLRFTGAAAIAILCNFVGHESLLIGTFKL